MDERLNILITAKLNESLSEKAIEDQLEELGRKLSGKLKIDIGIEGIVADTLKKLSGNVQGAFNFGQLTKDAEKFNNEIEKVSKKLTKLEKEKKEALKGHEQRLSENDTWTRLKDMKPRIPEPGDTYSDYFYRNKSNPNPPVNMGMRRSYFSEAKDKSKMPLDEAAEALGFSSQVELMDFIRHGKQPFDESIVKHSPDIVGFNQQIKAQEDYKNKLFEAAKAGKNFDEVVVKTEQDLSHLKDTLDDVNDQLGRNTRTTLISNGEDKPVGLVQQYLNRQAGLNTTEKFKIDEDTGEQERTQIIRTKNRQQLEDDAKKYDAFIRQYGERFQAITDNLNLPDERIHALNDMFGKLGSFSDKSDFDVFKQELTSLETLSKGQDDLIKKVSKLNHLHHETIDSYQEEIRAAKNLNDVINLRGGLSELQTINDINKKADEDRAQRIKNHYQLGKKDKEEELAFIEQVEKLRVKSEIDARNRDRSMNEGQQSHIQKSSDDDAKVREQILEKLAGTIANRDKEQRSMNEAQKQAILDNRELEAQAQKELDAMWNNVFTNRDKEARSWNQAQLAAISRNAELQRQEDAETQRKREAYQEWWQKSLLDRDNKESNEAERKRAREQKLADDYSKWWEKALFDKDKQEQKYQQDSRKNLNNQILNMYSKGQFNRNDFNKLSEQLGLAETIDDLKVIEDHLENIQREAKIRQGDGFGKTVIRGEKFGQSDRFKDISNMSNKQFKDELKSILQTNEELKHKQILYTKLDQVTGKWTATLKMNGEEQLAISGEIDKINGKLHKQKQEVQELSNMHKGLIAQFKVALERVPIWMASMTLFYGSARAVQDMVRNIIEIDTQMTELKRVMDSDTNFDKMLENSIGLARELGQTVQGVNEAMIGFGRQGFDQTQIFDLTKAAVIASNVSDLPIAQSMDDITAAMVTFNLEASKALTIVDRLNEVDNQFSITTADLANAMHKAGSSAAAYGVTIDELLGHITAIGEQTRESGNIVGTSLKTIYSRLATDDSVKALKGIGVSVFNDDGTTKKASDILDALGRQWQKLSNTQQQNIAVTIAGREQLTRFLALMQNYDTAIKATETSLNSQGSATRENDKYMNSLQARINKLQVAWQELSLAVGDAVLTQGFIGLVQALTSLANGFSAFTKVVGVLPSLFAVVTVAILAMNNALRTQIMNTGQLTLSMKSLTVGVTALGTAVKNVGIFLARSFAPAAILFGIGILVEKLIGHFAKLREESQNAKTINTETVNNIRDEVNGISKLQDEYEKLNIKTNKTVEEKTRLSEIQTTLVEKYGVAITGINEEGKAYTDSVDAIKKRTAALKEQLKTEINTNKAKLNAGDSEDKGKLSTYYEDRQKVQEKILANEKELAEKEQALVAMKAKHPNTGNETGYAGQNVINILQNELNDARKRHAPNMQELDNINKQIEEITSKYASAFSDMTQNYVDDLKKNGKKISDQERAFFDVIAKGLANSSKPVEAQEDILKQTIDSIANSDFDILISNFNELKRSFAADPSDEKKSQLASLNEQLKTLVNGIVTKLIKDMPEAEKALLNFKDGLLHAFEVPKDPTLIITSDVEAMQKTFQSASGEIKEITNAIDDLSQGQALTAETAAKLAIQYPQLAGHIKQTTKGYQIETSVLEKLKQERIDANLKSIKSEAGITDAVSNNLKYRLAFYGIEIGTIQSVADARDAVEKKLSTSLNAPDNMKGIADLENDFFGSDAFKKANETKDALLKYGELMDQFNALAETMKSDKFGVKDTTKKDDKKELYQLNQYEIAIQKIENQYKESEIAAEKLVNTTQAYRDELEKQNSLSAQRDKLANDEIWRLNQLNEANKKNQATMGAYNSLSGENQDKYNKLTKEIEDNAKQVEGLTQKQIEWQKSIDENKFKILTSSLDEIKDKVVAIDEELGYSENYLSQYNSTSAVYREELDKQIAMLIKKQEFMKQEADSIREQLASGTLTDAQAKVLTERLKALGLSWWDVNKAMDAKKLDLMNSALAEQEKIVKELDYQLSVLQETTHQYEEGTVDYNNALLKQVAILGEKLKAEQANEALIRQQIASGKLQGNQLDEWNEKLKQSRLAQLGIASAIKDVNDSLKQQTEKHADDIIQIYKDIYAKQKDMRVKALDDELDRLDKEQDARKKAHDDEVDRIEKEYDAFEEAANAKLKLIDKEANTRQFNNDLEEKQKNRKALQDKIDVLKLDDSNEAKKQRKTYQEDLSKIDKEIEELNYNRAKDLRKDNIQEVLDAKKTETDTAKDAAKKVLDNEEEKYKRSKELIDKQKKDVEDYYNNLINNEQFYLKLKEDMMAGHYKTVLDGLNGLITEYSNAMNAEMARTGKQLQEHISLIENAKKAASGLSKDNDRAKAWTDYLDNKRKAQEIFNKTGTWDEGLRSTNDAFRQKFGFPDGNLSDLEKLNRVGMTDNTITNPLTEIQTGNIANSITNAVGKAFDVRGGGLSDILKNAGNALLPQTIRGLIPDFNGLFDMFKFKDKMAPATTINGLSINVKAVGADKKGAIQFVDYATDALKERGVNL